MFGEGGAVVGAAGAMIVWICKMQHTSSMRGYADYDGAVRFLFPTIVAKSRVRERARADAQTMLLTKVEARSRKEDIKRHTRHVATLTPPAANS